MIEKVRIRGYRKFKDTTFRLHPKANIFVGDNNSGKSSLLEAIGLALTCRINGRLAQEELTPFWFNEEAVRAFLSDRAAGKRPSLPTISIELFLKDASELLRLHGAHNSDETTNACPGLCLTIEPDPDFDQEIEAYMSTSPTVLPVDYYRVVWRNFADEVITSRPRGLSVALIDSRTIRSTGGIDYHVRQMLGDHLDSREKAAIANAFRSAKDVMTQNHLKGPNLKIGGLKGPLSGEPLAFAMDQSSRGSWDSHVTPHVGSLPFSLSGQGQQAAVKISIALGRKAAGCKVVMVEEPENHLSHTSLNKLLNMIDEQLGDEQQLLVATHSSFVLNRLGLDSLQLVGDQRVTPIGDITPDTVRYFQRLPGFDTLRIVLADRSVLVEGPSDEILFERVYKDKYGRRPLDEGVDVISMRGVSPKRFLELAAKLGKRCAVLRDLDGKAPDDIRRDLGAHIDGSARQVFLGDPADGATLEPQLIARNGEDALRAALGITERADVGTWLTNNKAEAAMRIAESTASIVPPSNFSEAAEFIHG